MVPASSCSMMRSVIFSAISALLRRLLLVVFGMGGTIQTQKPLSRVERILLKCSNFLLAALPLKRAAPSARLGKSLNLGPNIDLAGAKRAGGCTKPKNREEEQLYEKLSDKCV